MKYEDAAFLQRTDRPWGNNQNADAFHPVEPDTRELKIKLLVFAYPLSPNDKHKGVFMWHHGRCGSTVPGRILNQQPGSRWRGEIYEPYAEAGSPSRISATTSNTRKSNAAASCPFELKGLPPTDSFHHALPPDGRARDQSCHFAGARLSDWMPVGIDTRYTLAQTRATIKGRTLDK